MYVYLHPKLSGDPYTVGFYDPSGDWHAESDHANQDEAASRVAWLNGSPRAMGVGYPRDAAL